MIISRILKLSNEEIWRSMEAQAKLKYLKFNAMVLCVWLLDITQVWHMIKLTQMHRKNNHTEEIWRSHKHKHTPILRML